MSTDFSVRPIGTPAPAPVARPLPDASRSAVETQLPPSQSVTQSAAAASTATATEQDLRNANLSRQIVIDRAASAIVYQVIDKRTSEVVSQFPEEQVLRRRAYARALDAAKDQAKQAARYSPKTDRTA